MPKRSKAISWEADRSNYLLPPSKATTEEHVSLDLEKTIRGRKRELDAMNGLDFGKVVSGQEAREFAETHGLKIIPSRWVLGEKIIEDQPEVRARMVVQEVAHAGAGTAASLGMSSCTPSGEAVRIMLALCSQEQAQHVGLRHQHSIPAYATQRSKGHHQVAE